MTSNPASRAPGRSPGPPVVTVQAGFGYHHPVGPFHANPRIDALVRTPDRTRPSPWQPRWCRPPPGQARSALPPVGRCWSSRRVVVARGRCVRPDRSQLSAASTLSIRSVEMGGRGQRGRCVRPRSLGSDGDTQRTGEGCDVLWNLCLGGLGFVLARDLGGDDLRTRRNTADEHQHGDRQRALVDRLRPSTWTRRTSRCSTAAYRFGRPTGRPSPAPPSCSSEE